MARRRSAILQAFNLSIVQGGIRTRKKDFQLRRIIYDQRRAEQPAVVHFQGQCDRTLPLRRADRLDEEPWDAAPDTLTDQFVIKDIGNADAEGLVAVHDGDGYGAPRIGGIPRPAKHASLCYRDDIAFDGGRIGCRCGGGNGWR